MDMAQKYTLNQLKFIVHNLLMLSTVATDITVATCSKSSVSDLHAPQLRLTSSANFCRVNICWADVDWVYPLSALNVSQQSVQYLAKSYKSSRLTNGHCVPVGPMDYLICMTFCSDWQKDSATFYRFTHFN